MASNTLAMKALVFLLATVAANPMFAPSSLHHSHHGGKNSSTSTTSTSTSASASTSGSTTTEPTGFPSSSTSTSDNGDVDTVGGSSSSVTPPAVQRTFRTTSTPQCSGTSELTVKYVTETATVTEMYTGSPSNSWTDDGPDLILPTPYCNASNNVPQWGASSQITSTVSATVKTTQQVAQQSGPAITFGGHGQGIMPSAPSPPDPTPPPPPPPPPGGAQNSGQHPPKEPDPGLGEVVHSIFPPAAPGGANEAPLPPGFPPGSNPQQINGVPVAVQPGGAIIGGSSFAANDPETQTAVVGGQTFTVLPSGAGVVAPGGMTVTASPGGQPTAPFFAAASGVTLSADGATFSFAPTDVVIGGTTYPYATPTMVTLPDGAVVSVGPSGVNTSAASATPTAGVANAISVRWEAAAGVAAFAGLVLM